MMVIPITLLIYTYVGNCFVYLFFKQYNQKLISIIQKILNEKQKCLKELKKYFKPNFYSYNNNL